MRLAYCQNLHAGEDLEGVCAGIDEITVPLKRRLSPERPFGVGMYLPGPLAGRLASEEGAEDLAKLRGFLGERELVPFTYNAFPHGGFHRDGLKEQVYHPAWDDPERVQFSIDVSRVAAALSDAQDTGHISISTHPGGYGAWSEGPSTLHAYSQGFAAVCEELARMEAATGRRIVLSLEAEPRASSGNSAELAEFLVVTRMRAEKRMREAGLADAGALAARHLGTCLDACHTAVEFEAPAEAWRLAQVGGACGKLQFSSALRLEHPREQRDAAQQLLNMAEPRYLHQVSGRGPGLSMAASDLPEVSAALDAWLACEEWRCHFHVPVDLDSVAGLATTRSFADGVLTAALAAPEGWGTTDLHVEIETYTWDVIPEAARGTGALVDGLEREYRHVIERLAQAGWQPN
ncbi:MAG: hypothetical protein ACI9HE_003857 [Planctomycetota bacterium]